MKIDQVLIEKFFAGNCTPEEALLVSEFLENAENRELYLNTAEWEAFAPEVEVDDAVSKRMNVEILNTIHAKRENRIVRMRYMAYAASVIIMISIGLLFYSLTSKHTSNTIAKINPVVHAQSVVTVFKNTSNIKKTYNLPDGSIAEIEPGSQISFSAFNGHKRDIDLQGEALFRVHKDKARPFTVYANNLATTALGTIFRVTARENQLYTKVKLIEGKVVVKPQNQLLATGIKAVYLLPGNMLTVNMQSHAAVVSKFVNPVAMPIAKDKLTAANRTIVTDDAIVFNDQSLAEVFNTLEQKLNITIAYTPKQVDKKVFTGQYEFGRDDAATFLNTLTLLNNLTVEKTEKGYLIKSSPTKRLPAGG